MPKVQVQHRNGGNGEQQADRQRADPRLRWQQPERRGQAAGKRNAETRQGDFQALAIQVQVDHVTEDVAQQQRETQAVEVLQPDRRHQRRTAQLPVGFDPEIHQQRQANGCQQ